MICLPGVFQCLKPCLAESITGSQGGESGAQVSWPTQRLKGRGRPSLSAVPGSLTHPSLPQSSSSSAQWAQGSPFQPAPTRTLQEWWGHCEERNKLWSNEKAPSDRPLQRQAQLAPPVRRGNETGLIWFVLITFFFFLFFWRLFIRRLQLPPRGPINLLFLSLGLKEIIHSFSKCLLCTHDASSCYELKGYKSKQTIISAQRELTFYWGTYCSHVSGKCMPFFRLWNFQTPGSLTMTINYLHTSQAEVRQSWPIPEIQQHWFQTRPRRVVSQSHLLGVCPSHQHGTQRNSSARDRTQVSSTAKRQSKRWSPGETSRYTVQN